MLHSRIRLIQTYLAQLPTSYLTDPSSTVIPPSVLDSQDPSTEISYPVLRAIQALLNRLPLVVPADRAAFEGEMIAEKNDVSLVALLGGLNKSVKSMKDVGKKFAVRGDPMQGCLGEEHLTDRELCRCSSQGSRRRTPSCWAAAPH
jgi:COP9 signalosome complex subunit 6